MIIAAAYTLIALVTFLGIGAVLRRFGLLSLGCLMDDGDGQGGVPPLPRRTRQADLGDLVVSPQWERHAARTATARGCLVCSPPFSATAPCMCAEPCGDPGCGALAWGAVSRTEEMEADW